MQSTDRRQIVEVGWIVDRTGYGDENLHLFVYHWINGVETCYNGCGWVQVSATRFPGMKLKYDGSASQYMIQYRDGNWWIGYQGEWIGYFPGSLWSGTYTASGLIQWFGELAADPAVTPPLSSIGNYYPGTSGNPYAAQITQINLLDTAGGVQGPATLTLSAYQRQQRLVQLQHRKRSELVLVRRSWRRAVTGGGGHRADIYNIYN